MCEWNHIDFFNLEQQILGLVKELKEIGCLREDYQFRTKQMIRKDFENAMGAFINEANDKH